MSEQSDNPSLPPRAELRSIGGWQDSDAIVLSFNVNGAILRLSISDADAAHIINWLPETRARMAWKRTQPGTKVHSDNSSGMPSSDGSQVEGQSQ